MKLHEYTTLILGNHNDENGENCSPKNKGDEDQSGFEPGETPSLEDTVLLGIIIKELIAEVKGINPKYGRILELLGQNRSKGQILEELNLGKSQGYADIKAAQKMARDLYYKD